MHFSQPKVPQPTFSIQFEALNSASCLRFSLPYCRHHSDPLLKAKRALENRILIALYRYNGVNYNRDNLISRPGPDVSNMFLHCCVRRPFSWPGRCKNQINLSVKFLPTMCLFSDRGEAASRNRWREKCFLFSLSSFFQTYNHCSSFRDRRRIFVAHI